MKKEPACSLSVLKNAMNLLSLLLLLSLLSSCTKQPPNVILILTDDQGYGDIACHGNPYVKTPALDQLYEESVRFTDFHVDPSCSPTRSALLTGCYSSRAGVWHTIGGRSLLKKGMTTIADVFGDNGYHTAVFGKWHLGENHPFRPQDRGFEESIVHGGGGVGQQPDYWGNDYFDDTYKHNGKFEKYEGYCNTVWFKEAINYIRKNKHKPFFCYLSTNAPHAPLRVEEKYAHPYKDRLSDRLANYYGMVTKLDEDLAGFLHELEEMGLEDNTILIFMTDNGPCPWFGGVDMDFETGYPKEGYSAGMRGGKIWGYENAHRVPLFIRWPEGGIGGGKDIEALTAHIDLMPTLIDLCDLTVPEDLNYDGQSLEPLLRGKKTNFGDRTLFVHNQRVQYPVKDKEYQVLTEKWRLVKREKNELYAIKNDPGQRNNLAGQYPQIVKELYSKYEKWWKSVSVDFDKYAHISIGTEFEDPVTLYAHDAFTRKNEKIWVVNVTRDGKYEICLNRWPEESGKRMVENRDGSRDLLLKTAILKVGNLEKKKEIDNDMTGTKFVLDLKAGSTCLHSSLKMETGSKAERTECVVVKYLGPPDHIKMAKYIPAEPAHVLEKDYQQKVPSYD